MSPTTSTTDTGARARADSPTETPPAGRRTARARLLDAATALFSADGIRAVGIDRVISEAGVARASLYSAFGSKNGLITAYLERLDTRDRLRWEDAVAGIDDPLAKIFAFFDLAIDSAPVRNFRGCQYLNAATEFPGELGGVLAPVAAHRAWLHSLVRGLLEEAGYDGADDLASRIQTIYDGALAGSKFAADEGPLRLGRTMAAELLFAD
ncbi:TetR/AcrR family transcriptional regulator [Tomitella gaofuii]|uniref:TetR/AcrR family transcriptional regulator n=1 Tax=Tomitella gaofuii TaxID=2760083 RepID=UPI0015FE7A78|nr:TetR/AcrR family transcriptional regulator [Tomitella gaofuii]